ncbi:MAG: hypothetical protein ACXVBF_01010 [Flavisolibacter sp.]
MKKYTFLYLVAALSLLSLSAFSQNKDKPKNEAPKEDTTPLLGLAGDNLDLYAVLDLFQKSKTIEAFEKSLNDPELKINNLDLNLDKKIDFIKVVTNKKDESYQFILRVDVSKTESQDVAVILLDKDKDKKVSLQIVGDEELYGKDYVIEPKGNSTVTPNPAYKGEDPIKITAPASTTTVVVESAPIVQYVYSPAYVPYTPPYYYGYYPPWFGFATVMAVGIYRSACWGYHGAYYGGHYGGSYYGGNNNVIINTGNRNNYNNYNNNKMRSTTVSDNRAKGNYGNGAGAAQRNASISNQNPSVSNRQSNNFTNRQSPSMSNRESPSASNRQSPSASNRQSPSVSNRQSSPSMSDRQTPSASTRQSSNFGGSSASSFGGGGRSMGGGGGGRSMGGGGGRSMGGGRRG